MGDTSMSEAPSSATNPSTQHSRIKGPQDFYGGLALVAIALFALWASSDLQGMRGFSFGPGTAPRMFGVLLAILGAGVALTGLLTKGEPLQRYGIRGPVFVTAAILFFSFAIRPCGLIITAFVAFLIAALGSDETQWKEAVIVGAFLTAGCALLFPYALGLPLELLPRALMR
jgi:putative tricarboxylic transport membrane protein